MVNGCGVEHNFVRMHEDVSFTHGEAIDFHVELIQSSNLCAKFTFQYFGRIFKFLIHTLTIGDSKMKAKTNFIEMENEYRLFLFCYLD